MDVKDILLTIILMTSIIALSFAIMIIYFYYLNRITKSWKKIEGVVLNSQLVIEKSKFLYDEDFISDEEIKTKVSIEYSFTLNGKTFTSDKVYASRLFKLFQTNNNSKKLYRLFKEGQEIDIYLNPKSQKDTILVKTIPITYPLASFFIFFFISLGLTYYFLKLVG